MMAKKSAGLLLFRIKNKLPEVLLVHPGGPFWKNKDEGAWTIPKGEFDDNEEGLTAAKREFMEETGNCPEGNFIPLKTSRQKSGKLIYAWAIEGDLDIATFTSNTFEMEWPLKSGKKQEFPEVDKAAWLNINEARQKINAAQIPFLNELEIILKS